MLTISAHRCRSLYHNGCSSLSDPKNAKKDIYVGNSLRSWRDKRGGAVLAAEPAEECVQVNLKFSLATLPLTSGGASARHQKGIPHTRIPLSAQARMGKKIGSHSLRVAEALVGRRDCQLLLTICDANKQAQCQRHSVTQDNLDKIEFLHQFWCHLSSSILQVPTHQFGDIHLAFKVN